MSRPLSAPYPNAAASTYHRHRPQQTELYSIINEHYPRFAEEIERSGGHLPRFVRQEFEDYLKCGLLEHGFLRVKCDGCRQERLVAFSCKRRGFCPSCGARRMVESAAHLVDHVFPEVAVRQFMLTFPFPLRVLLAVHSRTGTFTVSRYNTRTAQDLTTNLTRTRRTLASGLQQWAGTCRRNVQEVARRIQVRHHSVVSIVEHRTIP